MNGFVLFVLIRAHSWLALWYAVSVARRIGQMIKWMGLVGSVVVFLATAVLWAVGMRRGDEWTWVRINQVEKCPDVVLEDGSAIPVFPSEFQDWREVHLGNRSGAIVLIVKYGGGSGERNGWRHRTDSWHVREEFVTRAFERAATMPTSLFSCWGVRVNTTKGGDLQGRSKPGVLVLVRCWVVMVVSGVWPALAMFGRWRRRRVTSEGYCAECGYDLRATPGRCPECGRVAG